MTVRSFTSVRRRVVERDDFYWSPMRWLRLASRGVVAIVDSKDGKVIAYLSVPGRRRARKK